MSTTQGKACWLIVTFQNERHTKKMEIIYTHKFLEIKKEVGKKFGLPPNVIKLFYKTKILDDQSTPRDEHMKHFDIINFTT